MKNQNKMKLKIRTLLQVCFLVLMNTTIQSQSLTLKECINHALENNPDIQESILNVGVSKANVNVARSNFLPEIAVNIFQSGNFGRSIDRFTNGYIDRFYNASYAGLRLNMPLFTGNRNKYLLASSKALLTSTEAAQDVAKNTLTLDVLVAYVNALALYETIKNADQQLKNDSIQYERILKRKDAGLITKTEEIQLLNQMKSDEIIRIDAQLNYEIGLAELSRLLNLDLPNTTTLFNLEPDQSLIIDSNITLSEDLPQFIVAKWNIQSIKENIKATKARSLPSISLSSGYETFYASSNSESSFSQQINATRNGAVSLGITIPIFSKFQIKPLVEDLKMREKIAENGFDRTTIILNQELKLAKTSYVNLKQRYEKSNSLVELAKENMSFIQEQIYAGTATMVDFLLAQTNMERALTSLTNAKYQLILQEKILQFYKLGKFDFNN
jgi:outer membrane protein